jgi:hypothetical protein
MGSDFVNVVVPTGSGSDYDSAFYFDEVFVDTTAFNISDPNFIPEPATLGLVFGGLLAVVRRRR